MKNKNIEDVFCPDRNKLKKNEGGYFSMEIVDVELDTIECVFFCDDCVEINTKDYTYLKLSRSNLYKIIEALETAEEIYKDEL
tara:strand:+ start:416 stop:664 length:249 start_codon:yes stop_codon:yes gene_type:complete